MARADGSGLCNDINDTSEISAAAESGGHPRLSAKLSSASFRSATSYASFRSCKSIKSYNSRASFKSAVSRGNSYNSYNFYSCEDTDPDTAAADRAGLGHEGYQIQDNVSFYSCNDVEMSPKSSIVSCVSPRLRSVSDSVLHSLQSQDSDWGGDIKGSKEQGAAARHLAAVAVIMAGVAVAASTFVQEVSPGLPPWVVLMYRSLTQLLASLPLLLLTRSNPFGPPGTRGRLLVSALLNCFLVLCLHLAVARTPWSLAATLLLLAPVAAHLVSACVCGEHVGVFRLLSLCVYISGVVMVTRPPPMFPQLDTRSPLHRDLAQHNLYGYPVHFLRDGSQQEDLVAGVIAALATVILTSLILVVNRQCREVSSSVVMFWSSVGCVAMSGLGLYTLGQADTDTRGDREGREIPELGTQAASLNTSGLPGPGPGDLAGVVLYPNRLFEGTVEWLVATLISFLGVFATVILIKSAQYLPPGKISLLHTSQLVAAYLLVTSFSQVAGAGVASLHWLDLVGVLLVVFTLLAVSFEDKIVDIKRWSWF